jgi:hypothetical protein
MNNRQWNVLGLFGLMPGFLHRCWQMEHRHSNGPGGSERLRESGLGMRKSAHNEAPLSDRYSASLRSARWALSLSCAEKKGGATRPALFQWPLALPFWAATIWAFYPEWRLTRQARHSTTTTQSLDGGSFCLAFFYVLVALAAASILTFLPIIALAAAFPKWRPCHP